MKRLFKKIVALGLAATMAMGMAVTSFAADEGGNTVGVSGDSVSFVGIDAGEEIDGPWLKGNKKATLGTSETTDLTQVVVEVKATAPTGGKIIVGVSDTEATEPTVSKGKVTTTSDVVKASYKDGKITLKSNKAAGVARVWTVAINADKTVAAYSHFDVVVKAAANKINLSYTIGQSTEAAKKIAVPVGDTVKIDIEGLSSEKNAEGQLKVAEEATYYAKVDAKFADNITAEVVDNQLVVTAKALDKDKNNEAYVGKAVSAKVTVVCGQSEKKANVTIMVTNPAKSIDPAFAEGSNVELLYKKDVAVVNINAETAAGTGIPTTDKVKVYVAAPAKAAVEADEEKGIKAQAAIETLKVVDDKKVEFTKSKAVTAKLSKDGMTVTLTRSEVYAEAEIYLAYTDAATKKVTVKKLCFVEAVVPTEGDINLGDVGSDYAE